MSELTPNNAFHSDGPRFARPAGERERWASFMASLRTLVPVLMLAAPLALAEAPTMNCNVGPAAKTVGGSPWLVYACDDKQSVVLVSAPGSPAMPFIFMLHRNEAGYRLTGEGTGSKAATEATYKELNAMKEADIAKLHSEARKSGSKE